MKVAVSQYLSILACGERLCSFSRKNLYITGREELRRIKLAKWKMKQQPYAANVSRCKSEWSNEWALMLDCPKSILQSHTAWTGTFCHVTATRGTMAPLRYGVLWVGGVYAAQPQIFTSRQHPRSVSVVARENCLLEASYLQVSRAAT